MGAYLSEPNIETTSEDGSSDRLSYGASAMQGWRVAMEDSHNCITKLEDNTSLFAVYDGHGGAEVAIYTAQQLPKLLTELESFKIGDINAALEDAFMRFDASLKEKAIVEKLRRIAGMEDGEEKEEDNETETLLEEASLPLEQLVARYCSHPSKNKRAQIKQSHRTDLLSPMIQKKQPRFPLTAVNGSLQDGDGPVPNKTVPFDDEGDVMPKGKREDTDDDSKIDDVNRPDGDGKRDGENGMDSDDGDGEESSVKAEPSKNGEESIKKEEEEDMDDEEEEEESAGTDKSEAGTSGASVSCNGDKEHSTTKEAGSSSGSSSGSKLAAMVTPASDDEDDSDESDDDYQSDQSEEEDEEEEDEDEEEEDRGDFDEEEEEFVSMQGGREEPGSDSGSTAVVALLRGKELIVANIGDSRCVLSRGGKAMDMSYDHKPEDDVELRRIEKAGGKVTLDGRVNGGLNLSRAFGDHCYKMTTSLPPEEQMISAFPDIQTTTLTDKDDFMIIACDGIWNAMTSQEVIDFVQQKLESSTTPEKPNKLSKICEELFDFCLAPDTSGDGTGCDNMTCVIVQFHDNGTDVISNAAIGAKRKSAEDDSLEDKESKKPRH